MNVFRRGKGLFLFLACAAATQSLFVIFWMGPPPLVNYKDRHLDYMSKQMTNNMKLSSFYDTNDGASVVAAASNSLGKMMMKSHWKNQTTIASLGIQVVIKDSVQVFYSRPRGDRSGAAIMDMLMAHAFSWTLGRQYGGMCGPLYPESVDHRRMIQALGLQDELPLVSTHCEHLNDTVRTLVLHSRVHMGWKDTAIFTKEWLKYIRSRQKIALPSRPATASSLQQQQRQRSSFSSFVSSFFSFFKPPPLPKPYQQTQQILVHIRRGDVTPCMPDYQRYLSNAHYRNLLDKYTTKDDDTIFYNITIYSESESFEPWTNFTCTNQAHRTNLACHLVLDGDITNVWRDLLGYGTKYDMTSSSTLPRLLVTSISTFSLVPALLVDPTTTTVIYMTCGHKPLPHWQEQEWNMTVEANRQALELRQAHCPPSSIK